MSGHYPDAELGPIIALAQPQPADAVLDAGCGVGQLAFALAPLVASVDAVDDDAEMLQEAERLAAELKIGGVRFRVAGLHELPYASGSFSLVVAEDVLHRQSDAAASLGEMLRVLAPGGRIVLQEAVVNEITDGSFNELARLREAAHRRYGRAAEYEQLFRDCGLRTVETRQTRRSVDLDYWLGAAQASRQNTALARRRMQTLPVDVQAALDVTFSDQRASFSYDVLVARLQR